ncbi:MAG: extradiol ring-cleavage dioxygenase [Gammaproteobacteria bacterium]|nr:extradiol ring-cleavage dioxygenase [Gammaproteobacteria bacterium]
MAEILGVGITHYPPLMGEPDTYANLLRRIMTSPLVPEHLRSPEGWPEGMQEEWNDEHARAADHQARHKKALSEIRAEIDDFAPDAVIIFGDDQYENFKEDIIPPFNVFCMESFEATPYMNSANVWKAPVDTTLTMPGAGKIARELADGIISHDFPIAYSYQNLHNKRGMSHAFANAIVYLDWDQRGWNHPLIPISVNCYGRGVIHTRGGAFQLFDRRDDSEKDPYLDAPGPSGPTPRSCFALGEALREVLDARSERFVVMASSGWSHAFLTEKHSWLYPDRVFDRARFEELQSGDQRSWAEIDNDAIYDAGCQEFKNWICLAGVLPERTPRIVDYLETWIFNSQKCFAIFDA